MTKIKFGYLDSWEEFLSPITNLLETPLSELKKRKSSEMVIPSPQNLMKPFASCSFDKVKVVILGLHPYTDLTVNEKGESVPVSSGFCYGTTTNSYCPPHLKKILSNIVLNEYPQNFTQELLERTDVNSWGHRQAAQGVLFHNWAMTCNSADPFAHLDLWHRFSTALVELLAYEKPLVWLFLNKKVQDYAMPLIEESRYRHAIIRHIDLNSQDFLRLAPFTQVNTCLLTQGKAPIEW